MHNEPKTTPTAPITLKAPSHLSQNNADVIKSRLFMESSKASGEGDEPFSNRLFYLGGKRSPKGLFYLGGKRSPRIRKDPEWTSIRSEFSKMRFDWSLRFF